MKAILFRHFWFTHPENGDSFWAFVLWNPTKGQIPPLQVKWGWFKYEETAWKMHDAFGSSHEKIAMVGWGKQECENRGGRKRRTRRETARWGGGGRGGGGRHDEVQGCKGEGDSHTDTPRRLVNRGLIVPEEANLTSVSEVMSFPAKQPHFLSPSSTLSAPVCFFSSKFFPLTHPPFTASPDLESTL